MRESSESWQVLEFHRLRVILASFTQTEPGRKLTLALRPDLTRDAIETSLAEIAEAGRRLEQGEAIPVAGSEDLDAFLPRLQTEGTRLEVRELLAVRRSLAAAAACRRQLQDAEVLPALAALACQLETLPSLYGALKESFDEQGLLLDNASFELADIRADLRRARDQVRSLLEGVLGDSRLAEVFQERLITERNGRAVLPVKADFRGRIKGFVHDESGSGQTLYLEPAVALEANNRVQSLLRAEQREIERILARLSRQVAGETTALTVNQRLLARLDLAAGVGRYAQRCDARAPELLAAPEVRLRQARHPLLLLAADGAPRGLEVVPIDLRLDAQHDTLVISGPNTGGKTVALKTVGLLTLMVRAGLPIPCHPDSGIYPFAQVFADIGDEQSIEESLSTFSGHIARLVRILAAVDGNSLVLLDELGTGTDPAEGGALALALLDRLRSLGSRTVVTTHLSLVKGYAQLHAGVESAAVEFDPVTLAPAYRLHYGVPGASSAFTIARRLGLPEEVLTAAVDYLGAGEREGLELLEDLGRLRRELEQDRERARSEKDAARRERARRKQLLDAVDVERRQILDRAVQRADAVVRKAEKQVLALLDEARQSAADTPRAARVKAVLKDVKGGLEKQRPAPPRRGVTPGEVRPGELLWVLPLATEAVVLQDCGREIEVDLVGKRSRIRRDNLEQFVPRRFRDGVRQVVSSSSLERDGAPRRLLLVGMRVEEGVEQLARFIDDALLAGHAAVEVVHGSGSGRLRQAVRAWLREHRAVQAFYGAPPEEGGENVTVVELGAR